MASGFYRFMPSAKPQRPGDLAITNGTLQMLKVVGAPGYETAINQAVGVPLPVEWVTITNPDPVPVSVVVSGGTFSSVFVEGLAAGGARFRRLEGCWYDAAQDLFHLDQRREHGVWSGLGVRPRRPRRSRWSSSRPNHDMFDGPDNCCVSPRGGLVFCEDATAAQHVRGVSAAGDVFDIARNLRNSIEFAGACFSPDGSTLFVNLYGRGNERTTQPYRSPVQIPVGPEKYERAATVAIWGPWKSGPL